MEDTSRVRGVVKWFNDAKGYGFITTVGSPDTFVHFTEICVDGFKSLTQGQEVVFNLCETHKGRIAKSVTVIAEEGVV